MMADTSGKGMQGAVVALYGMVVRPTPTLCSISHNPAPYLAPSAAMFAAVVALGALFPPNFLGHHMGEIAWDGALHAMVGGSVSGLLPILGIFWVGRRWGGNRSLRRAFPALVYCLVPLMLGIVAVHAVLGLYALAAPETAFSDGLTAGFAYGDYVIQSAIGLLIAGWTLLLHVKAIHTLNGFGYVRSVAILALALLIIYVSNLAQGIAAAAIDELVL